MRGLPLPCLLPLVRGSRRPFELEKHTEVVFECLPPRWFVPGGHACVGLCVGCRVQPRLGAAPHIAEKHLNGRAVCII